MRVCVVSLVAAISVVAVPNLSAAAVVKEIYDQGLYEAYLESRNSNTVTNQASDQQAADDFVIVGSGLDVNRVEFWFTYRDLELDEVPGVAPEIQNLLIQIFEDDGNGDPGAEVYQANVSFVPEETGEVNGFFTPNEIFYAEINLDTPFQPTEGERYWISPLGANDDVAWQWQMSGEEGDRWSRGGAGGPEWRDRTLDGESPLSGAFAFRIYAVPEPSGALLLMGALFVLFVRRSRRGAA